MSQFSPLLRNNKRLTLNEGVYQDDSMPYRDSELSAELHHSIEAHLAQAESKALLSDSLRNSLDDRIVALLDPNPFLFLTALNFERINAALDLSQNLGGSAHFIADHVGPLDVIHEDPLAARLAAKRCANKPNVTVVSESLARCTFPEQQYDLILIGQLENLNMSSTQLPLFIGSLKKALTPNGILIVNSLNRERLTKLMNQGSESIPFENAYVSESDSPNKTSLSRRELRKTILSPGFEFCQLYATYAENDAVPHLLSEDYLIASVHALNHFYALECFDNPNLNPYLLFNRLKQDKTNIVDLATRYVAIASNSKKAAQTCADYDFFYAPDLAKTSAQRYSTSRRRSAQSVERLADSANVNNQTSAVSTPYYKGDLLSIQWLHSLVLAQHDDSAFLDCIESYKSWVASNDHDVASSTPSQLIVNPRSGEWHPTAAQSFGNGSGSSTTRFINGLYTFSNENRSLVSAYCQRSGYDTLADFIIGVSDNFIAEKDLREFASQKQQELGKTRGSANETTVEQTLFETFHWKSTATDPHTQSDFSVNSALRAAHTRIVELETRIDDLLDHREDLRKAVKRGEKQIASERNTQGNLYAKIEHLEARLHAQHVRNDELHHYLLQRPASRLKRIGRRWLDRLLRRPPPPAPSLPLPAEAAEVVEEVPFYDLPEGEMLAMNTEDYALWIQENTLTEAQIEAARVDIENMPYKPVFSILVPIYNTDPDYLLPMIRSVQNQIYPHWQLCLVDDSSPKTYLKRILEQESIEDARISIKLNDVNQGISVTTNDALEIATGDYIALLDHDDEITIDALYENAKLINASPESELIYSDEDKKEMDGSRVDPYFKPDYSPDLLDTNNYICHFTVIKKSLVEKVGGFREGMDGSQDHDLILRAASAAAKVSHIPRILYHWRKIPGSTAVEYDSKGYAWEAGRKAIEDLHQRNEPGVRVEFGVLKGSYRVIRDIVGEPLVSIIIPFKDKPELLDSCLTSILAKSTYANFEIIGVSNNSEQALTQQRMAHFSQLDPRIKFVEHNVPFNFSAICNFGVQHSNGEYLVLLNNDIEIISPDWIERMLEHAQRDTVGAVGCKLLFPDGRIQHAGVVAGMVGAAGHPHKFFPESHIGYNGRLHMVSNVSAVTGAMLMVSKAKFEHVGGLDQDNLAVAYNDIDFCLRLLKHGLFNVFTPHAKAYHHESVSRGYEDTDEKMQRLLREQAYFLSTWDDFLAAGDPFYNPNLSLKNERFSLNFKD